MTEDSRSEIKKQYEKAGMMRRIGFGEKPALLIVDFLKGFTNPNLPLGGNLDKEIEATAKVLELVRKKDVLVVFTTVGYDEGFRDAGIWIKKMSAITHMRRGSDMVEIDPRISPVPGEHIILKKFASAFFGTNLASLLTSQRVDTLIITGCTTSGCIRASVVDALQNGFRPIVPRECVGDRAQGPHEANLFDIDAKYGDVISLEEVLAYLNALPRQTAV